MRYLVLILAMLFPISAFADGENGLELSSVIVDKYIGTNGDVWFKGPVSQTELYITTNLGAYIDLKCSKSLAFAWGESTGDELDGGLGFETKIHKINFEAGFIGYLNPLNFGGLVSHIRISKDIKKISLFTNVENFQDNLLKTQGSLYSLGVYSLTKSKLVSRELNLELVYDEGVFGLQSGFLWKANYSLSWNLFKGFSIMIPSIKYFSPINTTDRTEQWTVGCGVNYAY